MRVEDSEELVRRVATMGAGEVEESKRDAVGRERGRSRRAELVSAGGRLGGWSVGRPSWHVIRCARFETALQDVSARLTAVQRAASVHRDRPDGADGSGSYKRWAGQESGPHQGEGGRSSLVHSAPRSKRDTEDVFGWRARDGRVTRWRIARAGQGGPDSS
jgi:hypothetical protein